MLANRGGSDTSVLSRRTFLVGLGGAGAALIASCGGSKSKSSSSTRSVSTSTASSSTAASSNVQTSAATQSDAVALRGAIRGHVFEPGKPGYTGAARVYNLRFEDIHPSAVARPAAAADVQSAVRTMAHRGVSVRARSGGHSYAGYSTVSDGVVIDLSALDSIVVDRRSQTARVGAGAQLIDVYNALAKAGAMLPGGSCPSVGISGVTLGGGFGLAGRRYGLTADNLVSADIVTADGRLRTIDADTDDDLLWALKGGGGGNFGIVTEFTFNVHPLPPSATFFNVTWPWSSATEAIAAWQSWAPHASSNLTSIFHLSAGGSATVSISGQYFGPSSNLPGLLGPLMSVPGASLSSGSMGYMNLQLLFAGCQGLSVNACHTVGASSGGTLARAFFNAKSDYVSTPLPSAGRQKLISAIEARLGLSGSGAILFDGYGGAINSVAPGATAFVHRNELFCIQYLTYNDTSSWLGNTWSGMRPYVSGQAYQNYIDHNLPNWQHAYYGNNYARLKSIRQTVDPHHVFNFPQAVGR
jgi:hypothetical protein